MATDPPERDERPDERHFLAQILAATTIPEAARDDLDFLRAAISVARAYAAAALRAPPAAPEIN